ncbi:MAG: CAAX prenyl protease-related protein [Verrucomicrobia bacterium]|nr:CAAX prenyl protease-related protein [Verrucomicrobiota bacterium]
MRSLVERIASSPLLVRVVPFVLFIALTFLQGRFGEASRYWIYFLKTLVGVWLIWEFRPRIIEMRWRFTWESVVVGVAVFAVWIGLDGVYPQLGNASSAWNPHNQFGESGALAWFFVAVRILGSSLVVPPLEEVFYRSFLYRYVAKPDFESVDLGEFLWKPFLITALVFGAAHYEWLPALLCGMAFQGLVLWKKRLGDAMLAHAIANLLLGLWVVWKGAWHFW